MTRRAGTETLLWVCAGQRWIGWRYDGTATPSLAKPEPRSETKPEQAQSELGPIMAVTSTPDDTG